MTLHVVSSDPKVPSPVTFERIGAAVEQMGASFEIVEDGQAGIANISGLTFVFTFSNAGKFLSIRILWETGLPMSMQAMSALFTASDQWNRERYFSTVYTLIDDGMISVCADYICFVEAGMNDEQLLDNISAGIAAGLDGMNFMQSVGRGVAAKMNE